MTAFLSDAFPLWQRRIKMLLESAWRDANINETKIDRWLENFTGQNCDVDVERALACHLLQQFIYFGNAEVDESMRVLFRDHFVYPSVQELRASHPVSSDLAAALDKRVKTETRFIGVGLPAESGPGMLYRFRMVNNLPTGIFPSLVDLFERQSNGTITCKPPTLRQLIFLDDLCATGDQVQRRMGATIGEIRAISPTLKLRYFILFGTSKGLERVRATGLFDEVVAAVTLDEDYRAFSASSLFYKEKCPGIAQQEGQALCTHYGCKLVPSDPLGFDNSQLVLGFKHNTPDNTLPIFWKKDEHVPWYPIFPRVEKH